MKNAIKIDMDNTTDASGRRIGYASAKNRRGWFFIADGDVGEAVLSMSEDCEAATVAEYPVLLGRTTAERAIRRAVGRAVRSANH